MNKTVLFVQRLVVLATIFSVIRSDAVYERRIDCFPEPNVTADKCKQRKCLWDSPKANAPENTPSCYFPTTTGYSFNGQQSDGKNMIYQLTRNIDQSESSTNPPNPYLNDGDSELSLKISTSYYGPALRVRIEPDEGKRYEPTSVLLEQTVTEENGLIFEPSSTGTFSFTVKRNSTGSKLWDTSIGGMLFADQYIQIATLLPTDKMYGWGENAHHTIKHDFSKYKTWGMFGRDQPPQSVGEQTLNLYGVQPFYMALESDNNAHGVFILNSNAQEITTGPDAHFVYRTIGGILDIFFLPGPTPEEVVKQFQLLVGKPYMPAYFALGFQLSRYGYVDLDDMKAAVNRTVEAGIPLEIPYADIDYMKNFADFTLSPKFEGFKEYGEELHQRGMKLFLMFDVGIDVTTEPFQRALDQGANFIQWPSQDLVPNDVQSQYNSAKDTDYMLGVVWPNNHCAFPDFLDTENNTFEWWISEFQKYHDQISFDGIWIDMNEPANFGTNLEYPWYFDDPDHPNKLKPLFCNFTSDLSKYDFPKFRTHNVYVYDDPSVEISDKTLCMRAKTNRNTELLYNTKSLYALYEARATLQALERIKERRGAIITRANYPGIGQYAGHWLGDNNATWSDLLTSIVGIQEYNIFGIPYIGADICGFHGNTTSELCLRWHQLGAFYTFSSYVFLPSYSNHNGKPYIKQDPAQWDDVKVATKTAYYFRYRYLPYLYSLHFEAHLNGGTVIRPVFFEFPDDPKTHDLGMQFMWGNAMMIVPVYAENVKSVYGYLPEKALWYSLRDSDYGQLKTSGDFSAETSEMIPVFIRGGTILTTQDPAQTTDAARKNPMKLVVAMNNYVEVDNQSVALSEGFLYWDDGLKKVSSNSFCKYMIRLIAKGDEWANLHIKSETMQGQCNQLLVKSVDIFGFPFEPDAKFLIQNGVDASTVTVEYTYDAQHKILRLGPSGNSVLMMFKRSSDQKLVWRKNQGTQTNTTPQPVNPTTSTNPVPTVKPTTAANPTTTGCMQTNANIKGLLIGTLFAMILIHFAFNC